MAILNSIIILVCATCVCKIQTQCPYSFGEPSEQTSLSCGVPNMIRTSSGAPVDSMVASLTAGPYGPMLMQDSIMMDMMAHFTREKIPARVGHAKGAGAFGYFVVTDTSFTKYCKATLFQSLGKKTDLFLRFSTATQEIGTCDTLRSLRGTAIKFYTEEGNWDLVGNNIPIFSIRHPALLPSVFHIQKPDPSSGLLNTTMFWDFVTKRPETCYQLMLTFSDRGIPDGYRHMHMHGSHTFKVVNKDGNPFYCKFHFRTNQGIRNLNSSYAASLCGSDPDYARRDLYNNVEAGNFPSWTMCYQIMTFKQAETCKFNPFDLTKVWPQGDYPYHEIGKLVLNKNPMNFFADVEQSAFSPAHLIPGIEPSPDPMYHARMFSYSDTQRYRLGVNYNQLPINRPIMPVININQHGFMDSNNQGSKTNYYPSSFSSYNVCKHAELSKWSVSGDVKRTFDDEDNFTQPGIFYRCVLNETQKAEFITNIGKSLMTVNKDLQASVINMFNLVDQGLSRELSSYIATSS